jgi:hypothetical protein
MNLLDRLKKLALATKRAWTLGLKPHIGFHTIWTRPNANFHLDDFEVLTLITSALAWKANNGPIWLYTDHLGAAWVYSNGLGWLYDRVVATLDDIPCEIDAKLFWAAGKLYAYQQAPVGSVSIDYDAIVWQRLPHYWDHDIVALHPEPTSWGGYKRGPIQAVYGEEVLNWRTDSLNASILIFNDEALKDAYTTDAIRFMLECSKTGKRSTAYENLFGPGSITYIEEMIFAEQRLLVMLCIKMNKSLGFITGFDLQLEHAVRNNLVTHLWNSKRGLQGPRPGQGALHALSALLPARAPPASVAHARAPEVLRVDDDGRERTGTALLPGRRLVTARRAHRAVFKLRVDRSTEFCNFHRHMHNTEKGC